MSDRSHKPRLHIPPGTNISAIGGSVTIHFFTEAEADEFMEFIKWLTTQDADMALKLTPLKRVMQ